MRIIALLVAAFFVCAAVANAQEGPPPGPPGAREPLRVETGGPDGPGGLRGFLRMMPLMAALDTDEDGEISPKEIKRAIVALKTLDKDGNGKLTEDELRPEVPRGGPGGTGGPVGPGGPGGRPGAQNAFGGPPGPEVFVTRAMEFDEDMDGKLSRDELTKMAQQFTRRPPQDGDGAPRGRVRPQRQDPNQ